MRQGVPSIKGSVIASVVPELNRICEERGLGRDDLLHTLEPSDFELLDEPILSSGWYDVRAFARLEKLLMDLAGDGDPDYLRERGRLTAQRLLEAGMYQQLEYLHRTNVQRAKTPEERVEAYGRDLRLLTTMSSSLLNFSVWKPRRDPEHERRWLIDVTEAEAYPDVLAWNTEGFMNGMAQEHGEVGQWRWERVAPDHIVFRMDRDL